MALATLSIDLIAKVASFEKDLQRTVKVVESSSRDMSNAIGLVKSGLSGLVGAFTYLMWLRLAGSGKEYRAFSMIGLLLGAQLIFGVIFGGGWDWVGDLAGFVAGFALTVLVAPGGIPRLMDHLRQR